MDSSLIHPLHHDIIKNQATINIGMIGHVSHGKSTIIRKLTGINPSKFKKNYHQIELLN